MRLAPPARVEDPPLLSLCMIVRDGGEDLGRSLESVRGVADELVVVDTGSRDGSPEIARAAGARVLPHPWQEDFAAARNVSLEAARGRWILVLDADEELECQDPGFLRSALRPPHVGFYLPVISPTGGGEHSEAAILRLFEAGPDVRFRYPIHEQVVPDLLKRVERGGGRFGYLPEVTIRHSGYDPTEMERRGKIERNRRLFEKALAREPDCAYLWYKYADFLRSTLEKDTDGVAASRRACQLVLREPEGERRKIPFVGDVLALRCASLLETGRPRAALALLDHAAPDEWRSPHYDYVAGLALEHAGRLDEALGRVRAAVEAHGPVPLTARSSSVLDVQVPLLGARLWLRKGDAVRAEGEVREVLGRRPDSVPALRLLADARALQGDVSGALRLLTARLRASPEESSLWLHAGALLLQTGQREAGRSCLQRAAPAEPAARDLLQELGV